MEFIVQNFTGENHISAVRFDLASENNAFFHLVSQGDKDISLSINKDLQTFTIQHRRLDSSIIEDIQASICSEFLSNVADQIVFVIDSVLDIVDNGNDNGHQDRSESEEEAEDNVTEEQTDHQSVADFHPFGQHRSKKGSHKTESKESKDLIDDETAFIPSHLQGLYTQRKLIIFVYSQEQNQQHQLFSSIQRTFNAAILRRPLFWMASRKTKLVHPCGGKSALDSASVRHTVMRSVRFSKFIEHTINEIEKNNLTVIGIKCSDGKLRSATCAYVLNKYFYPSSIVWYSAWWNGQE